MKQLSTLMLIIIMSTASTTAWGQQHYSFNCRDYVSTDDNRAPQSAFTYDATANTIGIAAKGKNNVALKMATGMDDEYYIDPDETMLVVSGENLSTGATDSYVWWLNGANAGETPADMRMTDGNQAVIVWNLLTNSRVNRNFDFSRQQINISSYGASFINAMGMTAADQTKPGVITDLGYYAPFEVAAKHPSLMTRLGFNAKSLTTAIKAKTLKLNPQLKSNTDNIGEEEYAKAYNLYREARKKTDTDEGTHTSSYEVRNDGLMARFDNQYIRITFFNDSTVHVSKAFSTTDMERDSWAIVATADASTNIVTTQADDRVTMQTGKLKVEYTPSRGTATFYDHDGKELISEVRHRFIATTDGPFDSYTLSQYFHLDTDERIYGMGQLQDGHLDRRGTVVKLEQENRSISIPYFLSSKNYGLYWDNYSPTTFNDLSQETFFRSTGRCIDYYILAAANSHEVQRSLRNLTGQTELPPLWNFGLYQSKERYASTGEVMDVVKKYRQLHIPLDCIVQDWQYWGDNAHWNAMEFLNPSYTNYQEMIDFVHSQNAKLMISIWASFGPQTRPFAELKQKGLLFTAETWPTGAGVKPYNPYSAEARDIYWRYLLDGVVSKGIDAYWMDSTEPDFFGGAADLDNVALKGQTWRSLRNVFPLATVQGVAQHHRAEPSLSGKRVSIMTRSGYVGMQRTGAYVWSADITSSWATLKNQIAAACNLSESGLPYWNSDTGGFFTGTYKGVNDPAWRRLYTRWTQFSVFTPMLRFHGTDTPREPWQFGSKGDNRGEYDNIVRYIKMRYSMLPYLYSTAHQVRTDARTFMQALPIAFPADTQTYDVTDQYMFGQSILVAPVVEDGVQGRNVYLPQASTPWIDFWTGYTHKGGQTIFKTTPADIIPLYIPAGTIMPWGPEVEYSSQKTWDNLEIRIYPGADGQFTLYEDAFDGYEYEQGQYTEIPMTWNQQSGTLTIGERRGKYDGMLAKRKFNIVVVSPDGGTGDQHATQFDATVDYTGKAVSVKLKTTVVVPPDKEECTNHIVNPSFEADGHNLTKVAPKGWSVNANTAWWGVNAVEPGATGDPQPTDGRHLFGVWDASSMSAIISQTVDDLPAGKYHLTVDIHASNRDNAKRAANQCVFADDQRGYLCQQVTSVGTSDDTPMQTISVDFQLMTDKQPVTIGVATDDAPAETWFKVDNFRLYRFTHSSQPTSITSIGTQPRHTRDAWYTPSGIKTEAPTHGTYLHEDGSKVYVE